MDHAALIACIEQIAPPAGAAAWDNCGVQVAGTRQDMRRLAVTIDPAPERLREALAWGADMVLTHHPLYMEPRPLSHPGYFLDAARAMLASGAWLFAAHTSLDVQPAGPAGWLARALELTGLRVLEPTGPDAPRTGFGLAGELPAPLPWDDFAARLADCVERDFWALAGERPRTVGTVAYCTGSGAALGGAARAAGADVLVTGDLKYHQAMEAEIFTIDVGHFSLEERMVREMAALLDERLGPQGVAVRFFPGSDPLRVHLPR